jgi:hypothetical protein
MATKADLVTWTLEALRSMGGAGTAVQVCREVWLRHEPELRNSGDLFYTWQYDIRWAAQKLRNEGVLAQAPKGSNLPWRIA